MLRRTTGLVAIGAGVFLLVLAALLRFYAVPTLEKLPSDEWSRQLATGTGTVTNPKTGQLVHGAEIVQDQWIHGDAPQPGSNEKPAHSVAWTVDTWLYFKTPTPCVTDPTDKTALSHDCALSYTGEHVAVDDHTGKTLPQWSGDHVSPARFGGTTALHHDGYVWKFPFHMSKADFPLWDAESGKSYPAKYVATETVTGPGGDSIKTYKFVQTLPPMPVDSTDMISPQSLGEQDSVTGPEPIWYDKDITTVWIDPISGLPIKGTQEVVVSIRSHDGTVSLQTALSATLHLDQIQKTDDNDKPQFDAQGKAIFVNYTDQAIRDAKRVDRITLLRDTVPLWGGIAGLILLIAGIFLTVLDRRAPAAFPAAGPAGERDGDEETKTLPAAASSETEQE